VGHHEQDNDWGITLCVSMRGKYRQRRASIRFGSAGRQSTGEKRAGRKARTAPQDGARAILIITVSYGCAVPHHRQL